MAKKRASDSRIVNRRAKYDYELGDTFIVGLQLTGAEVKSLRLGHGQLTGSYVNNRGGELWLVGAQIMGTRGVSIDEQAVDRSRKVLAKKAEIEDMLAARQQGKSIIPLEFLNGGRYIKLRVAIGRGKKRYDKRESLKRRQQERDISRAIKR